jgi:CRISPR-associated exonuclease Cas4
MVTTPGAPPPLLALLAIGFLVLVLVLVLATLLARWSRRRRRALGVAGGTVVAADDSRLGSPTLRSARLGLVGRCDHLLRVGDAYVPVEHKPRARRLYPSHVLQAGALCLLVEDVYGVRPPHAVVVLAGGAQERVPFTADLERDVRETMARMRRLLAAGEAPGPRWVAPKCRACGFRPVCWAGGDA